MMKLVEARNINALSWKALAKESQVATWFQTQEAFAFFANLTFLEAFAYAVESDSKLKGVVVGYIQKDGGKIKQYLSRRAIIVGGPLLSDDITDEELGFLLSALKNKLRKKAIFIETRNFNDYNRWRQVFEQFGYGYDPHYDVQVDTTSIELVNSKLDRNRKRNIKKALCQTLCSPMNCSMPSFHVHHQLLEFTQTHVHRVGDAIQPSHPLSSPPPP